MSADLHWYVWAPKIKDHHGAPLSGDGETPEMALQNLENKLAALIEKAENDRDILAEAATRFRHHG